MTDSIQAIVVRRGKVVMKNAATKQMTVRFDDGDIIVGPAPSLAEITLGDMIDVKFEAVVRYEPISVDILPDEERRPDRIVIRPPVATHATSVPRAEEVAARAAKSPPRLHVVTEVKQGFVTAYDGYGVYVQLENAGVPTHCDFRNRRRYVDGRFCPVGNESPANLEKGSAIVVIADSSKDDCGLNRILWAPAEEVATASQSRSA